jgi:hypothetical protein
MLSQKLDLVNTHVDDVADDPSKQISNAFKISSNSKSFIVLASSQTEKFDWLLDVSNENVINTNNVGEETEIFGFVWLSLRMFGNVVYV